MKTTLILSAVIFLAALSGCSDNMNVTDPISTNHYVQNQPNHTTDPAAPVLIWNLDELKVWTVDGEIAENKATYVKPPLVPALEPNNGYLITFKVSTNADKLTNGYVPAVTVSKDSQTLYSKSDFTSSGETSANEQIMFRNCEFSQIQFYIALFQADIQHTKIPGNSVVLTLSDIRIYR